MSIGMKRKWLGLMLICSVVVSQYSPMLVVFAEETVAEQPAAPIEPAVAEQPAQPETTQSGDTNTEASTAEITSDASTPAVAADTLSEEASIGQASTTEAATTSEQTSSTMQEDTAASNSSELADTATSSATTTPENIDGASGGSGSGDDSSTPHILSGKAVALANILNIVNTNTVNSQGAILFSNFFDHSDGVDLRTMGTTSGSCQLLDCTTDDAVEVHLLNDAVIDNLIRVNALSGENAIDTAGQGVIQTGDAYAGLNLINVANTNFVDSQYLLVTVNAFEGVDGDIVFPGLLDFFSSLLGIGEDSAVAFENTADVVNTVAIDSNSGDNNGSGTTTIETGDAHTSSNVFNQINTSLLGGHSISLIFRVHGNWAGDVFGVPDGFSWNDQGDGSFSLTNDPTDTIDDIRATGTSTALINNDVYVDAISGRNAITGAETSLISTGNAYAGVNIINVANANVIGRNWILAIINIFGDFNGSIAFGRPDLWVGEQIDAPASPENGTEITYKFTVINNGDSSATDAKLSDAYDSAHIDVIDSSAQYVLGADGQLHWDLGNIPPQGAIEITYRARIKNAPSGTDITNTVTASEHETDNNLADNTDTATLQTRGTIGGWMSPEMQGLVKSNSNSGGNSAIADSFAVVRRTASTTVLASTTRIVHQELVLSNTTGNQIPNVSLHDTLYDPSGRLIGDEVWDLGMVRPHEDIVIGYDISFTPDAPWGVYDLSTYISNGSATTTFNKNGSIFLLPKPPDPLIPSLPIEAATTTAHVSSKIQPIRVYEIPVPTREDMSLPATNEAQVAAAASSTSLPLNILLYLLPFIVGGLGALALYLAPKRRDRKLT